MRTFLAIPIPDKIIGNILEAISEMKKLYPDLRWVASANYHLTLRFLGDISDNQCLELQKALAATRYPAGFELELTGFGAFPSLRKARVFWIGFNYPQELIKLYQSLEEPLENVGIKIDKSEKFKPHLTLARAKQILPSIEKVPNFVPIKFSVEEFFLYKSDLRPQGPIYTKLQGITLNKN